MRLFKKKQFVFRVIMFGLTVFFSLSALALILHGSRVYYRASKDQHRLGESNSSLMTHVIRIQAETTMARDTFEVVDLVTFKARVGELVDEADKASGNLASVYSRLNMRHERDALLAETRELTSRHNVMARENPIKRDTIAKVHEEAVTLERMLIGNYAKATSSIKIQARLGRSIMYFAGGALAIAIITGALLGFSVINEKVSGIAGEPELENELQNIQASEEFRVRMQKLSKSPHNINRRWQLSLYRILDKHYTHNTFEATARRAGEEIILFGKCYCWAGFIKGMQRVIWPGYGKASWNALNRMHNYGINTAFPVILEPVKRNRFKIGYVLLTEHVGDVTVFTSFLSSHFAVMTPENRRKQIEAMLNYWNKLHDSGIFGLKARSIHISNHSMDKPEEPSFYLFDLDRVMVKRRPGRGGVIGKLLIARDNRRLRKRILESLTAEEILLLEEMLKTGKPPKDSSSPAA